MKTKLFVVSVFFLSLISYSQNNLSVNISAGEQFVKKDRGECYEIESVYKVSNTVSLSILGSFSNMKNKNVDIEYKLNKYAIRANYGFGISKSSKIESIFGFSYLVFDNKLNLDENKGIGLDLGIRSIFKLKGKLKYGLSIVNTYSTISPGGIINSSLFLRYNL